MGLGSLFRGKECGAAGSSLFKNAGEGQIGGEDYDVKRGERRKVRKRGQIHLNSSLVPFRIHARDKLFS